MSVKAYFIFIFIYIYRERLVQVTIDVILSNVILSNNLLLN